MGFHQGLWLRAELDAAAIAPGFRLSQIIR